MRICFIAMMMTLAHFVNAQVLNSSKMQLNPLIPFRNGDEKPPQLVQLPTMTPLPTLTNIEKAQAKLAREEQKLIKLARNAWDLEDGLKKEQDQLKNLENVPEKSSDPDHQKRIKELKQQIAKSQKELDKAKIEVQVSTKKVEDLEKAIDGAKFTRQGELNR